jgi:RNA polymerase sigma-70 factor (ECF subfamily)
MPIPWPGITDAELETSWDAASDAELVRLAQQTPHAFAPLYRRYRDPVINYCYYRLGNRDEAEDAASAIFIKTLRHLAGFTNRGDSFRTWLFRIAHNEVADRYRQRSHHPQQQLTPELGLRDPASSPEEIVVARDSRQRVLGLLSQLPPRERSVLELRTAELTTPEIAQVLAISEQSVRTAQSRAIGRLRGLLGVTQQGASDA